MSERLDAIRDRVGTTDRVVLIARDLVEHGQRRLTQCEHVWLCDALVHGRRDMPISFLQPREYDALIRALLSEVRHDELPEDVGP